MPKRIISLLSVAILLCPLAYANDIEGRWMLSLQDKKRTLVGLLEIEKAGDGWTAYLEGGPTTVENDGARSALQGTRWRFRRGWRALRLAS